VHTWVPVDAVKRVAEVVGQGIRGGDGAGASAEGCYCASMGDDWRVCIAFGDLPRQLMSCQQALISAIGQPPRRSGSGQLERYPDLLVRPQRRIG
jgi:hypothetical protein